MHDLSTDETVLEFARRFRIALLLHEHCAGKRAEDPNDMNMDPSKGLGRALSAALDQFASASYHRELASTRLIFLGFSGAGPLSARLVGYFVSRALAAVLSASGHFELLGIDTVELTAQSLMVPEFIIAGSADNVCGTTRPYLYFKKYRDRALLGPSLFKMNRRTVVPLMQGISFSNGSKQCRGGEMYDRAMFLSKRMSVLAGLLSSRLNKLKPRIASGSKPLK